MKKFDLLNTFGPGWWASGAVGFGGQEAKEYWYDPYIAAFVPKRGLADVAKTITALPRLRPDIGEGNMPLDEKYRPQELFPKSIYVMPHTWNCGSSLNAVGLSNPGIERAFEYFRWHEREKPIMLSFMPMGKTRAERLEEVQNFVALVLAYFKHGDFRLAIQLNVSCPNTGHGLVEMQSEIFEYLEILAALGVPIILKVNALFPVSLAIDLSKHPACAAISPSNTIPFGQAEEWIPWEEIFGGIKPEESPLAKRFPLIDGKVDVTKAGGYAGPHARDLVVHWIIGFRSNGGTCHINAGNGIQHPDHVREMMRFGRADSISIGSIKFQRPLNIRSVVREAHRMASIL